MGLITALNLQVNDPGRISVFIDGEFAVGLAAPLTGGLAVGQEITVEELDRLRRDDDFYRGRTRALGLLARRPYSAAEIEGYLRRKDYDAETARRVVESLKESGYVDDQAFAAYWLEQRETFRPRSRRALESELRQKGVERQTIEGALEDFDDFEAARRLAEKQARRLSRYEETEWRTRLQGYLLRQGFSYEVTGEVVEATWKAQQTETEL